MLDTQSDGESSTAFPYQDTELESFDAKLWEDYVIVMRFVACLSSKFERYYYRQAALYSYHSCQKGYDECS